MRTIIAEPISGVNDEEKNERLTKYEETLDKVRDVLNDSEAVEEIIKIIGASESQQWWLKQEFPFRNTKKHCYQTWYLKTQT